MPSTELSELVVPELSVTIQDLLGRLAITCAVLTESQEMALHVRARLSNIFALLLKMKKLPANMKTTRFCTLLARFHHFLRTLVPDMSVLRVAKSHKAAAAGHTFHGAGSVPGNAQYQPARRHSQLEAATAKPRQRNETWQWWLWRHSDMEEHGKWEIQQPGHLELPIRFFTGSKRFVH